MGKHVAGQMRSLSFYRDSLVIHEDEKSRNQQRLRLFFLRVQVPGNTLTPCIFSVTFDSKTDSKTGGLRWIFMDRGRHPIGLWSGWKTVVDGEKQEVPKGGFGRISGMTAPRLAPALASRTSLRHKCRP